MVNITLLEIIARSHPQLWEAIHPHVPVLVGGYRGVIAASEVELNPQPIPPGHLVLAGAALAREVSEGAVLTHAQSRGGQGFLLKVADEWCGNGARWPWPPGWPHPVDPDPHPWFVGGPDPSPWEVAQMFAAAALVFARFASDLEEGELRDAFRAASDKAGERAVTELTTQE
jgi:hypothetical protein